MPLSFTHIQNPFERTDSPCVVVADDVDAFRNVLCQRLRDDGFLVLEAGNGAELLDLVNGGASEPAQPRVDLVITTTCLLGHEGVGMLLGIQAKIHEIPLILLDRSEHRSTQVFAHQNGVCTLDCLPLSLDVIRAVVSQHLLGEPNTGTFRRTLPRTANPPSTTRQALDDSQP